MSKTRSLTFLLLPYRVLVSDAPEYARLKCRKTKKGIQTCCLCCESNHLKSPSSSLPSKWYALLEPYYFNEKLSVAEYFLHLKHSLKNIIFETNWPMWVRVVTTQVHATRKPVQIDFYPHFSRVSEAAAHAKTQSCCARCCVLWTQATDKKAYIEETRTSRLF